MQPFTNEKGEDSADSAGFNVEQIIECDCHYLSWDNWRSAFTLNTNLKAEADQEVFWSGILCTLKLIFKQMAFK